MSSPCSNCGSDIRACVDCGFYKGKYIEIPDNVTNGNMIKALFPNIKCYCGTDFITVTFADNEENTFDLEWWNAKYKGGKE